MNTIAQRLFDSGDAECELEEALTDAGVEFKSLGWDYYDCSLEIHGVAPDDRLSGSAQKVVYDAGFAKVYVNHTDKWETHYSFKRKEPFSEVKGWRVSYPHKRGANETSILLEERVPSWPKEWFESGYCRVVHPTTPET
jgi:hypothetical protein